jgi:lipopolysaccharide assembly outer membrane protein LptD (OstA)
VRKAILLLGIILVAQVCDAQKLIEYSSGMGSRDPENANVWVLYNGVVARHEGMKLESDSAHYDTEENSFTAFGNIIITLTDTTLIFGDRLLYDGDTRIVDIWDDTVVLVDGRTHLIANHITYERNRATAYYTEWGRGTSENRVLISRQGQYNSERKEFNIYNDVVLWDSTMRLETDTLIYNTKTKTAYFESPTYMYSDSSTIYSELGNYNTETRFAISYLSSHVDNQGRMIDCDTLYYDEAQRYGKAYGHVIIVDSVNDITCTGRYGETNQENNYSFVTDSAHVLFVDKGDSLFLHADTVYVTTDTANHLQTVRANYRVKLFRRDAQAMCDSAFYNAIDSVLYMYQNPVIWYEHYQCSADTIVMYHDTAGMRMAYLNSDCFAMQQVDLDKFNQLSGRNGVVHFADGEPMYADVLGNAQLVYYITEDDTLGHPQLMGVNVGMGTDIRIYFDSTRAPGRVVAYDKPDMKTYPVMWVPEEFKRLQGFNWQPKRRPRRPEDVFEW